MEKNHQFLHQRVATLIGVADYTPYPDVASLALEWLLSLEEVTGVDFKPRSTDQGFCVYCTVTLKGMALQHCGDSWQDALLRATLAYGEKGGRAGTPRD